MKTEGQQRTVIWRALILLPLILLAAALGSGLATSQGEPLRVHPAVQVWSDSHPGESIPIIVQTHGNSDAVADFIRSSGGTVQREFHIVPAVEADVSPTFVSMLASYPGVTWVSLDAPVVSAGGAVDTKQLVTTYPYSVNANDPWSKGYTGKGIGVAVVDTGVTHSADFGPGPRIVADVALNTAAASTDDGFGHGTHVAGIVGGYRIKGKYIGIAPGSNLLNVKVADEEGNTSLADVIAGLEWVYDNKDLYNIRVVNLSLHSSVAQSYKVDPLDAAVEFLWFNNVFVAVAAGNLGDASDAVNYPPANDPFVMTVGAIDDRGTTSYGDDVPTAWSSFGTTQDGFAKPELVTPGRGIVSAIDTNSTLYEEYPDKIVDQAYFRLSGTSMSAAVMSGVAALVLERHPDWTPGELKCTLIAKARHLSSPYDSFWVPRAGDTSNQSSPKCNSDTGLTPNVHLLGAPIVPLVGAVADVLGASDPTAEASVVGLDLTAAGIGDSTLDTVDWSAIKWDAIKWDAIKWDAIKWDAIKWDAIKWDAIKWDAIKWDAIKWDAIKWDAIKWDAIKWDAIKWDAIKWDAIKWDAIKWDFLLGD
jgi:serine protease AprX